MRTQSWPQTKGEAFTYDVDGSVRAGRLGTTVTAATWSVVDGSATITGETIASGVATALITTASEGCAMIKVKVEFADSSIKNHFFQIKVSDPHCAPSTNKY